MRFFENIIRYVEVFGKYLSAIRGHLAEGEKDKFVFWRNKLKNLKKLKKAVDRNGTWWYISLC